MSEPRRNGGDLVVETLAGLGATTVFGIPGQHALGLFDALGRSPLSFVSARIENNAAFATDGFARATGRVGVLFLSTGPGALTALAGLQEALATGVPMLVVSSQIPRAGLGGAHKGMLHQLDDQQAAAANVAKRTWVVQTASQIPSIIEEAWGLAQSAPAGPVWIEIPQDILLGPASLPRVTSPQARIDHRPIRVELLEEAARLLSAARTPVILAGGGARRSGAQAELLELAERLDAPVVMTASGKGCFPWRHPLSVQSWVEDRAVTDLLSNADTVLVLGSSLGEVTSNYFTFQPSGRLIQIDAEVRVLESNHPALGIHGDIAPALRGILAALPTRTAEPGSGASRTAAALDAVRTRLDGQPLDKEQQLLDDLREAIPDAAHTFWDMTIAGYWAWSAWDPRAGEFHSAQGAGGLGFGFPAAIGAAMGRDDRVLAVSGDGGAMYSISELATARQHDAAVTWLIIDDGGYGILREYMTAEFGAPTATELARPDFVALAQAFGVPARAVAPSELRDAVAAAWGEQGPNVIVVQTHLSMFELS